MTSAIFKQHKIRLYFACLVTVFFISTINACTVKRGSMAPGIIPTLDSPSPRAEKYGKSLFESLCKKYDLDSESHRYEKLVEIFRQLTIAAEVGHIPWHIYLLEEPEIVDIRAVYGNYIFVWSGIMDAVENDDELAAWRKVDRGECRTAGGVGIDLELCAVRVSVSGEKLTLDAVVGVSPE